MVVLCRILGRILTLSEVFVLGVSFFAGLYSGLVTVSGFLVVFGGV